MSLRITPAAYNAYYRTARRRASAAVPSVWWPNYDVDDFDPGGNANTEEVTAFTVTQPTGPTLSSYDEASTEAEWDAILDSAGGDAEILVLCDASITADLYWNDYSDRHVGFASGVTLTGQLSVNSIGTAIHRIVCDGGRQISGGSLTSSYHTVANRMFHDGSLGGDGSSLNTSIVFKHMSVDSTSGGGTPYTSQRWGTSAFVKMAIASDWGFYHASNAGQILHLDCNIEATDGFGQSVPWELQTQNLFWRCYVDSSGGTNATDTAGNYIGTCDVWHDRCVWRRRALRFVSGTPDDVYYYNCTHWDGDSSAVWDNDSNPAQFSWYAGDTSIAQSAFDSQLGTPTASNPGTPWSDSSFESSFGTWSWPSDPGTPP